MNRMIQSSAFTLAFGYVGLGIAALILFAAPLWYAWQVTIQDGRVELLQADTQRLAEVFRRDGPAGLKTFIDTRVGLQIAGERIADLLVFDDAEHMALGRVADRPPHVVLGEVRLELSEHPRQPGRVRAERSVEVQNVDLV